MKLRTKIQLFSSIFMLVLILLINTSVYFLFNKISADSELDQLAVQTEEIIKTLNENPDSVINELLNAFLPTNGMIRVFQKDGNELIPKKTKEYEYSTLPGEFSPTELHYVTSHINVNVAVISKPVIWKNGEIVTLQVSKHLISQKETMTTLFYVLIVASVIMLIPTIIGGAILSRFLLSPIKALIQTMKDNTKQAKWQKIDLQNNSHDELYEMEKTFNDMIDHLKDNFEKQEVFVSDASHELKTPISIIKSYAQLLGRRGQDNPELFKESVEAIDSESDRMQKLVEQMLLLAKNKNEAAMQNVNFTALCEDTITTFKGAYSREIQFNKMVNDLFINGNSDQLQQIIYILIDNALKYSEGEIKLLLFEHENEAVLKVTDNGQGIAENEQLHIFDRFYRLDKARSRDTGGTGLGLPIAKTITESHHGELSVQSNVGQGSTFTLKLPLVKESVQKVPD